MKNGLLTIIFLAVVISLIAQEKGLTPLAGPNSAQTGSTYAVVVGISDYQDDGIPDLRFSDKDAVAFANFLRSPAGGRLDEDHLKVLLNEEATAGQFAVQLDWLWEVAGENDRVIIYFSGHGDVERKSITQPGYLLCWDAPSRVYMSGGAFNVRDLKDVISTLSIQNKARVVLITDACRSGTLSGNGIGGSQATAANLAQQFANEIKILSCQPDEYSIEGEQWGGGRGAFSYHLLDGLNGLADVNGDLQVSLMEISRYLEDMVTAQVAPQSQIPMTVGNKGEKLTDVVPELLARLKREKTGEMPLFATTESRGMEADVLATADSSVVVMYWDFQSAVKRKEFLSPERGSADFYYRHLSIEPQLARLHSTMRRNFAAALQDDAQQVLNKWLACDISELGLSKQNQSAKYKEYPDYLERASELLGPSHYMNPVLQSRKRYFEGYLMHIDLRNPDKELGERILAKYREADSLQPESPYIHYSMGMVQFYQMQNLDSAEYYMHRAISLAPSWIVPYSMLGFMYLARVEGSAYDLDKARYFLEQADELDSISAGSNYFHMVNWGTFYLSNNQLALAEAQYKKCIEMDSTFGPYANLGIVYAEMNRFKESERQYKKALQMDSTQHLAYAGLGDNYFDLGNYKAAERNYLKALQIDSTLLSATHNLGYMYLSNGQLDSAEIFLKRAVQLDGYIAIAYLNLGNVFAKRKHWTEAGEYYKKSIQLDSMLANAYFNLAIVYLKSDLVDDAEDCFEKIIQIDSTYAEAYYFLACIQGEQGHIDLAFDYLEKGLQNGYGAYDQLVGDSNLGAFRERKGQWQALMIKYFPDQVNK